MNLERFNKHWQTDFFFNIDFKRVYFQQLKTLLEQRLITSLIGLRRVGKTTLLWQLIDYLIINQAVDRFNIVYYSFDNGGNIESIINNYLKISNKDLEQDKIYFFLDEIQKAPDWQNKIKIFYDLYPQIKFIISWSSSIFLGKTESLAGRIIIKKINPLYFSEYLKLKKLDYYLEKPNFFQEKILFEFEKYLWRQFPETVDYPLPVIRDYLQTLVNKIIKEDLTNYFKPKYPEVLIKLFEIIANQPGMIIDYSHLAKDLKIDWRTVQTYLHYLVEWFLLQTVSNYSHNYLTSQKKSQKIYLTSTSFLKGNTVTGEIFENYLINTLEGKYFWKQQGKEIDLILEKNDKILPIEIKFKNELRKTDFRHLQYFMKKNNLEKGIIITKNTTWKQENIEWLPFWEVEKIK